jgi:hypothetical protein
LEKSGTFDFGAGFADETIIDVAGIIKVSDRHFRLALLTGL